jgi:hypothetical protein
VCRELFAETSGWEKGEKVGARKESRKEKGGGADSTDTSGQKGERGAREEEHANGGNGGGEEVDREFVTSSGVTVRIDIYVVRGDAIAVRGDAIAKKETVDQLLCTERAPDSGFSSSCGFSISVTRLVV